MEKIRTSRSRSQAGRQQQGKKKQEAGEGRSSLFNALSGIRQSLYEVCVAAGMEVLRCMLREEQDDLCGPRYKHQGDRQAHRHGYSAGEVVLGGRRVSVVRPRVRSKNGKEISLRCYEEFSHEDPLTEATLNRLLAGVATRSYERTLEPVGEGVEARGASKSAVSRRFVTATQRQVDDWLRRPLDDLDLAVVMVDGLHVADHTVLVALGIDVTGKKHILGVREGVTENATVCKALLADLVDRGLRVEGGILVVIDGAKALRKAARAVFGRRAVIQRCQLHKIRNVVAHLPKGKQAFVRKAMTRAYRCGDAEKAKSSLIQLAGSLEGPHPGAASSLREGLDETLTVLAFGLSEKLTWSLSTTNPIESTLSTVRKVCRNVKRWRGGKMVLRWTVAGLLEAELKFRRLKGMKDMPLLVHSLKSLDPDAAEQVA